MLDLLSRPDCGNGPLNSIEALFIMNIDNMDNSQSHGHLIAPHGGELVDLKLDPENAAELKARSRDFPSWDLTSRQIRDLELLLSGGFSPLRGFMNRDKLRARLP